MNSTYSPVKINKLEVAINHLETAIELFFLEKDAGSVHTLSAAARRVLKDIAKTKNISDAYVSDKLPAGLRKKVINLIHKPQNFFKHADQDTNEILEWNPELTEIFLFESGSLYTEITNKTNSFISLYAFWFAVKHNAIEKIIEDAGILAGIKALLSRVDINQRKTFLELLPYFQGASLVAHSTSQI